MTDKYKIFVFDLDGTLFNTSEGIVKCVEHTISELQLNDVDMPSKLSFIGPPVFDSFKRVFGMNEALATEATLIYRQRYWEQGLFEADIYPGILEVLKYLKNKGVKITVATLKPENFAVRIMEHFGISCYFDAIVGVDLEGSLKKADTIRIGLKRIGVESFDGVLMIGDSEHDQMGANEVGVDFCAVTYGFGFESGTDVPHYVISNPLELIQAQ